MAPNAKQPNKEDIVTTPSLLSLFPSCGVEPSDKKEMVPVEAWGSSVVT